MFFTACLGVPELDPLGLCPDDYVAFAEIQSHNFALFPPQQPGRVAIVRSNSDLLT